MAAPTEAGVATTSISSAVDPWTVNLPASIAVGDILLAYGRTAGAQTFNLPTGWSWLLQNDVSDATDDATSIMWKVAAGEGTTFSWDLSGTAKGAVITYRVTGAEGGIEAFPASVTYTTTANTANPPASGTLPSDDYLVFCPIGQGGEGAVFTAPTNYVSAQSANSGTAGAVTTNCAVACASRQLTGITSEDPGTWTHSAASGGGLASTIVIRQLTPRPADLKRHRRRLQAVNRGSSW
jgi:hypothetical protein